MVWPESSILEETPTRVRVDSIKVGLIVSILLTDILNNLVDLFVWNQRKDGTLQGCNQGWKHEVGAGGLMRTDAEAVLENAVHDTANTERGFNY